MSASTTMARRAGSAAFVVATVLAAVGAIAAAVSPHAFAESDTVQGGELVAGALAGLAMFLIFYPLPQVLFGLALRSGRRWALRTTAVALPVWILMFGLAPVVGVLLGGASGVSVPAVSAAAATALFDAWLLTVTVGAALRHVEAG